MTTNGVLRRNNHSVKNNQNYENEDSNEIGNEGGGGGSVLVNPISMSSDGNRLAITTLDGQLNVWDTLSSEMVGQYIPTSHLSATCTKISWPPAKKINSELLSKPKKLKSHQQEFSKSSLLQDELHRLSVVALGTANGSILLFNVLENRLHSILSDGGHVDRVNDIDWCTEAGSLFSCSNDKFVIEWSIETGKVKQKEMLDRSKAILSICVLDQENLITAQQSIKWWNWSTKQLLKTFHGHSTEVTILKSFACGASEEFCLNDIYFVSSAISDRYINAWKLENEAINSSIATYALDDEPVTLEVVTLSKKSIFSLLILSITRNGHFFMFEDQFDSNSRGRSAPIKPIFKLRIGITSPSNMCPSINNGDLPTTRPGKRKNRAKKVYVPFLFAHMISSSDINEVDLSKSFILMCYGDVNRPSFERVTFAECQKYHQKQNGIMWKDPKIISESLSSGIIKGIGRPEFQEKSADNESQMKIKTAKSINRTTVIGPAGFITNQPLFNNIKNGFMTNGDSSDHEEEIIEIGNDDHDSIQQDDQINTNKRKHSEMNDSTQQQPQTPKKKDEELTIEEKLKQLQVEHQEVQSQTGQTPSESEKFSKKRKKSNKSSTDDEESGGLTATSVFVGESSSTSDSMVNVLMQGLQSQDKEMLQMVFSSKNETMIQNTVRKLPVDYIPRLLTHLQFGMTMEGGGFNQNQNYLIWLTALLQHRITFFMTTPKVTKKLTGLKQILSARTSMLERCLQLKGRLDIMMSQLKSTNNTTRLTRTKALMTYESETSSDEDEEEIEQSNDESEDDELNDNDLIDSESDSDDNNDNEDDVEGEEMYNDGENSSEDSNETNNDDDLSEDENDNITEPSNHRRKKITNQNEPCSDDSDDQNEDDGDISSD